MIEIEGININTLSCSNVLYSFKIIQAVKSLLLLPRNIWIFSYKWTRLPLSWWYLWFFWKARILFSAKYNVILYVISLLPLEFLFSENLHFSNWGASTWCLIEQHYRAIHKILQISELSFNSSWTSLCTEYTQIMFWLPFHFFLSANIGRDKVFMFPTVNQN